MTGSVTRITPAYDLASETIRLLNLLDQKDARQVVLPMDEKALRISLRRRAVDLMGHGVRL